MAKRQPAPSDPLRDLLDDWHVHLRATNKSTGTITSYLQCGNSLCDWLEGNGLPDGHRDVTKQHLELFFAQQLERLAPATVAKQYRSLQQLFKWLVEDGELDRSPMETTKAPQVPEQPVPVLDDDFLSRLLKAADGNTFENRRDTAIIRLFLDTGMRAGELIGIRMEDVDRETSVVRVMGKGRRPRDCPFGLKTSDALRRYLRERTRHKLASTSNSLWLGKKGPLTSSGVAQMLERRCDDAGLERIHPHQFRHTAAHAWLLGGGQETDLMRVMGWRAREMVNRYGASVADDRAREAHRRLGLGDRV